MTVAEQAGKGSTPPRQILVVDDDPAFAGVLEDVLAGDGHVVTTASSGRRALELLAGRAFDLILLDVRMPEIDGAQFFRELQQRDPDQARRVIVMTGGAVGAEAAEILSAIRTPFLRKPLEIKDILGAVQRFFLASDSFRAPRGRQP